MKQQDLKQESFEAWFAKLSARRKFRFEDPCNCLIASWVKETGLAPNPSCGPGYIRQDVDFEAYLVPPMAPSGRTGSGRHRASYGHTVHRWSVA